MTKSTLIPTAEAARIIGADIRTVLRMVERGQLEPVAQGPGIRGAFLFDPHDIAAIAQKRAAS
jgi:hypothetical protein